MIKLINGINYPASPLGGATMKRTSPSLGPADDIAEALMAGHENKALRSSVMPCFPERLSPILQTVLCMPTTLSGWGLKDLDST